MDNQEKFHQEFEVFLDFVEDNPEYYTSQRLKYLRDFVSVVSRFPSVYCDGDDTIRMPSPPEDRHLALTEGYVQSLANLNNEAKKCSNPILSVLVVKSFHKRDTTSFADTPQSIKFTELKLVDGDGQKIHARLNCNLVEIGSMLKRGDRIRLDMFTPIKFRINEESPRMPMLFIH